ncbi:unnamed protein product [Penicillium bialowiezense]
MSSKEHEPEVTAENVAEILKHDTKVKVAGVDVDGILRGKIMKKDKFLSIITEGFGFCSVIFGWDQHDATYYKELTISNKENGYRDLVAVPDLRSFRRIPWEGDVPFFLISFLDPDTREPVCACPRGLLKTAAAKAEAAGYRAMAGAEYEFYQFRAPGDHATPERGASATAAFLQSNPPDALPSITEGMFGYSITRPLHNQDYYYGIFDACEKFRCDIEGWHTESGPGVFEAALQFGEAKDMADKAGLFKYTVKAFGIKHGITPCFMAKPRQGLPGNSGHMHISLVNADGKNAFIRDSPDPSPQYPDIAHLSDLGRHFLAGLLVGLPDIMPILAPTINSYKRLVENFWAPVTVSWGLEHRAASIRLITPPTAGAKATRFEVRVPGADTNAHFVLAAILALGWRGVEKKLEIPVPPLARGEDMGGASDQGVRLAKSLKEAIVTFSRPESVAREVFGDSFVEHFAGTREHEVRLWEEAVTDWEMKRYIETVVYIYLRYRIYLPIMSHVETQLKDVSILGSISNDARKILTKDACAFLALLHRTFNPTRKALLQRRVDRQAEIDKGNLLDFLPETRHIRENDAWKGAPPAPGLVDRRVEITGPTDRKMVVNALNSDVWTYMADFEDSSAPTWDNMVNGQVNLYDAIRRQVDFKQGGKEYKLRTDRTLPTLIARARGWHLDEKHFTVDGEPISGGLFDFGLYFFHNAKELVARGAGPYFYLPKMESHLEARLWNDVFNLSQDYIGLPRGTIRGTVLIETITAAFEMDEIIYELRDHSSGLNCGRWDYIFSFIKKFRNHPNFVLPDRSDVTMTVPFMDSYVKLLIKTCHRRGVHAMGGMAAQIPIKNDPAANDKAMESVRADKLREVRAGHDGTWVAHPALAAIASDVFNKYMPTPNQLFIRREEVNITANDLLNTNVPGKITEDGIRKNLNIGLSYMEGWLRGVGCVPINFLMEDAATAEVSRSQLWQWTKHNVSTSDGKRMDKAFALRLLQEQADSLAAKGGKGNKFQLAARYFAGQVTGEDYADFLTSLLYNEISSAGSAAKL